MAERGQQGGRLDAAGQDRLGILRLGGVTEHMHFVMPLAWAIGIVAMITCTVGNFAAYRQESVKRMLAYSSIAHAGYMLMASAVFLHPEVEGHQAGVTALVLYVAVYLFMNLGASGSPRWFPGKRAATSWTRLPV